MYYKGPKKDQIAWLSDIARRTETKILIRGKIGTLWADFDWNNVSKEGDTRFPNGKKPVALIQRILSLATRSTENHLCLDFFAGSGSVGHAVLAANASDQGNRRFILVQIPEPTELENAGTISNLCIARLNRVIRRQEEASRTLPFNDAEEQDLGFRVFKLAPSTFPGWAGITAPTPGDYVRQMDALADPLIAGHDPQAVLWEVAIKEGFPLTSQVTAAAVHGHVVHRVADPDTGRSFHICLDSDLTADLAAALHLTTEDLFVCRDIALDDTTAANLALQCRLKTI